MTDITDEELEDDVDIDQLINDIDGSEQIEIAVLEPTDVPAEKKDGIDLEEKHSLANRIVENSLDVIKNAKMVFTHFSDDVLHGKDRSESSKETLIKALDVQNQANKNLIDLAKTLNGEKTGNNTNILIASSLSPKKTGIDINNIKDHFGST